MKKTKVEIRYNSNYKTYNVYVNDIHAGYVKYIAGYVKTNGISEITSEINPALNILNKRKDSNNAMKLLAYKRLISTEHICVIINHNVIRFGDFIKSAYGTTLGICK